MEYPFVGRLTDFTLLDREWQNHRIFGIFGIRSVGKTRFVEEFLKTKTAEVVHIELRKIHDIESVSAALSAILLLGSTEIQQPNLISIFNVVIQKLKTLASQSLVVLSFDNAEDIIESKDGGEFLKLCTQIVKQCRSVKIFITSTTTTGFSGIGKVFFSYELKPLSEHDSITLLHSVAPKVDLKDCAEEIAKLSEGLPLLLMMIGSELSADDGLIEPKEMIDLLTNARLETVSGENYPPEERVAHVYRSFIERLSEVYRIHLTELDYIPGSFSALQAHELLVSAKTEALTKITILRPIRIRNMLTYESTSERFNIQGILREVIKVTFVIRNKPEIRCRYIKIFTKVMVRISERIGTVEYTKAMAEFSVEQPNLQKLLTEVHYTTVDTYHFFIEIATTCSQMIETFMTAQSEDFYQACLDLANKHKKETDKVGVYISFGSLCTNTKGDFNKGEKNYRQAMKHLNSGEKSLQMATLYQRLGWNLHRQGDNEAAVRFYKLSLAISMISGSAFRNVLTQYLSSMGIALTILGDFETAERYHLSAINHRKQYLGEKHPFVGASYNNLGLLYQQKNDHENSLNFFMKALEIKKETKASKLSIISSISNAANANNYLERFDEAHALLDEALDIIEKEEMMFLMLESRALINNTRGKIFLKEGKLNEALGAFKECVKLSEDTLPSNYLFMKRLVSLGKVQAKLGYFERSLKTLLRAKEMKDDSIKQLPHNEIVTECLDNLSTVYDNMQNHSKLKETLLALEQECLRLERVCFQQQNLQKLDFVYCTLASVDCKLLQFQ